MEAKCTYFNLRGKLGEVSVRIFLIRYGYRDRRNVLVTVNMSLSFVKAFEIYQMRWSIEVLNKETKQYLGLGSFQRRYFDKLIADCTLMLHDLYCDGTGQTHQRIRNNRAIVHHSEGSPYRTDSVETCALCYRELH